MIEEDETRLVLKKILKIEAGARFKLKLKLFTFRLPTYLIQELRNDSELEEVSLNSFVTRIFLNHIQ
jgi:predicted HicB family RNase H-like nuclease